MIETIETTKLRYMKTIRDRDRSRQLSEVGSIRTRCRKRSTRSENLFSISVESTIIVFVPFGFSNCHNCNYIFYICDFVNIGKSAICLNQTILYFSSLWCFTHVNRGKKQAIFYTMWTKLNVFGRQECTETHL
jgi:hypothetical protein